MSPPISCSTALHSLSPLHKSRIDCKSLKKYQMREIIMMLTYETRALMAYTSVNKSPTALKGIIRALLAGKDILAVAHTFKYF